MSKRCAVVLVACFLLPRLAAAQAETERAEMKKVEFLVGEWDGEGWVAFGPGPHKTFTIHESVQRRLDGLVVVLEGVGRSPGPGGQERITHQALATVAYDPRARVYRLSAYREGSGFTNAEAKVATNSLIWGFSDPRAGDIRFTIRLDDQGRWTETGETSRDGGKSWHQFLEMTLHRH
jgi:hypothetical protein